jgi:hypothetical protein
MTCTRNWKEGEGIVGRDGKTKRTKAKKGLLADTGRAED